MQVASLHRRLFAVHTRYLVLFFLCQMFLLLICPPLFAVELTGLDTISTLEQSQTILQLDRAVRYGENCLVATETKPGRCYVDLYSTHPLPDLPQYIKVDEGHISAIRIGIHGTTTRVVVDLRHRHSCTIRSDSETQRIVITSSPVVDGLTQSDSSSSAICVDMQSHLQLELVAADPEPEQGELGQSSALLGDLPLDMTLSTGFSALSVAPDNTLSVGGRILGFTGYDLKKESAEDHRLTRLRSRLHLQHEGRWREQFNLQGRATIEWDILDSDNKYVGSDNDMNLYEAYLKLSGERWDISVGRQRVRWGKSDQLSPLDSINPDDLRQFMTIDLEERKIPSWLARLRLHGSKFTVETILIPWFEESELDYFDSDWALYRNLRQSIVEHPQLPQAIKDYAMGLRVHEQQPADALSSISGAVRLSWQTERSDYAISYRYGWETLPTITSFPVRNITFNGDPHGNPAEFFSSADLRDEAVESCFKRQQIVGFEWEAVFDLIGFRGEIAYFDHVSLLSTDLTSVSKEVVHAVAGIDYTTVNDWYFNVQTSWYRIFDCNSNILYFEQDNLSLLGELRKTLWRGNLELSTRYNYTIADGSCYLQPALKLKYFPNVECEVGVVAFSGDGDTMLGSHDQADQVYAQIKYLF